MKCIEIFRAGTHTTDDGQSVEFSEVTVRMMAAAYDPARYEAPLVIGHPATDAPAYGWVKGLEYADGRLSAYVDDLDASFAGAVKAKRYRNISASFYRPDAPHNPKPGVHYLRHVGFLGATPPAVKGLKAVNFADAGTEAIAVEIAAGAVQFGEVSAHRDAMAARIAELEAQVKGQRQEEVKSFLNRLVSEARLPQGLHDLAFAAIDGAQDAVTVSFSEGGVSKSVGQREALMRLLASMPPMVTFGEMAPFAGGERGGGFVLPEGYLADPAGENMVRDARDMAKRQGISFAEAIQQLTEEPR